MSTAIDTISTSLSFNRYMQEIKKYPRLSAQEEIEYFTKYINESCVQSAYTIVTSNLRFVVHVARQYKNYKLPIMEIIQEGNIGLMRAVKSFSLDKGVRFATYAVNWIRSNILSYVSANVGTVKFVTSKPRRKLFFNRDIVYAEDGSVNNVAEISSKLNVSQMDVKAFLEYNQSTVYLSDEEEGSIDLEDSNNDIEQFINQEHFDYLYSQVSQSLARLSDRDRDIIHSRILADKKLTLQELADRYKVSCERIRQLEASALKKIKQSVLVA